MRLTEEQVALINNPLLQEVVEGFLTDLHESFKQDFVEPFGPLMSSKKIRKIAAVMAGATGAGIP